MIADPDERLAEDGAFDGEEVGGGTRDDAGGRHEDRLARGRRIGCADAGHVFDPDRRKVATRLLVDDANPSQRSYLLELVDNPVGVKAIVPA